MSNLFNTLLWGNPEDIVRVLNEESLSTDGLQAALTNAMDRVGELEKKVAALEDRVGAL